jgi:hypothetical protein
MSSILTDLVKYDNISKKEKEIACDTKQKDLIKWLVDFI